MFSHEGLILCSCLECLCSLGICPFTLPFSSQPLLTLLENFHLHPHFNRELNIHTFYCTVYIVNICHIFPEFQTWVFNSNTVYPDLTAVNCKGLHTWICFSRTFGYSQWVESMDAELWIGGLLWPLSISRHNLRPPVLGLIPTDTERWL